MTFISKLAMAVGSLSLAMTVPAIAQDHIGKEEYELRCAVCHGTDSQGEGPMARSFDISAPNLTVLSKNNGGVYPFGEVYEAIDGRRNIDAHGTSQMPLWGRYFTDKVRREGIENPTPMEEQDSKIVQGRILSLVYYIYTLQGE